MKEILIDVTERDILNAISLLRGNKGRVSQSCNCPIAIAATRALGRKCSAAGHHVILWKNNQEMEVGYLAPSEMLQFIRSFDSVVHRDEKQYPEDFPKPFSFTAKLSHTIFPLDKPLTLADDI